MDTSEVTGLYLEAVEENQNQVQEPAKVGYQQVQGLGIRQHKKRLLEDIQKPNLATHDYQPPLRIKRLQKSG